MVRSSVRNTLLTYLLILQVASAQTPQGAPGESAEIGLATGSIVKAWKIQITDEEVTYRQSETSPEIKIPVEQVQFVRNANGEYQFFPGGRKNEKPAGSIGFYLVGGVGMHFAKNTQSREFITSVGNSLAFELNRASDAKGFTAALKSSSSSPQLHAFVEPRIYGDRWMFGLGAGYATFAQISSVVQSPYFVYESTASLSGFFIPITATYYWLLPLSANTKLHLGFGAGITLYIHEIFRRRQQHFFRCQRKIHIVECDAGI